MFSLGNRKKDEELREKLAEYAHMAWSGWMEYIFKTSLKIPLPDGRIVPQIMPELTDRWIRQMLTHYDDLSEEEKESDRKEADKILAIFSNLSPRCEDCSKEISCGTGIERNHRLTPLCSVCQGKRLVKFGNQDEK